MTQHETRIVWHILAVVFILVCVQVGEFVLVSLAYALPAWNHLLLAGACINTACLLLYPLVSESARWLLSQGRVAEATVIMRRTARANKTSMPAQPVLSNLTVPAAAAVDISDGALPSLGKDTAMEEGTQFDIAAHECHTADAAASAFGVWQVLCEPQLAYRLGVLLLNWYALYLAYYGITVSSGGIPGSV